MQCVILAGGLGTRMRPLTETCPKTLLPAGGRPFAYHQMHWLAAQGITEVIYSIGHYGDMIRRYWDEEPLPVPSIRYVDEGERLRGTAGALHLARDEGVLDESFFVIYGDSFLPVKFGPVWRAFQASEQPALMTVLRNEGRWDRSNAIYQPGRVVLYDKALYDKAAAPGMQYIDYGLSCFRRDVFDDHTPADLAVLFHELSISGRLAAFQVHERFYEIGSPEGLRDFEQYIETLRNDTLRNDTCETPHLSR
jgi:NDP-sugar pyrophosphorylase family protein